MDQKLLRMASQLVGDPVRDGWPRSA